MSRYNQHSGSGTGSSTSGDFDDITLKLQKYSAIRVTGDRVNAFDSQYGDKFIAGFDDVEILDGIVFQRDNKPGTWKVFSPGKFFNVDPDTGKVYEQATPGDNGVEYSNEMSAQEILDHPRVVGFSETFGGNDYFYTPVGAIVEGSGDMATNNDLEVKTTSDSIVVGEVSMLLSNSSWVRTLAKLITADGDDIIAKEEGDNGDMVSVTESHGWLTNMDPELREGIEGREMELFIIEETAEFGDEEVQYTTPILLDAKTGERITIDNFDGDESESESESDTASEAEDEADSEAEQTATADGGTQAASTSDDSATASPDTTESADEPEAADEATSVSDESGDDTESNADDFEEIDDLLDYFARTDGEVEPDELREFSEDEVDDLDSIDWEAAAAEVERRA